MFVLSQVSETRPGAPGDALSIEMSSRHLYIYVGLCGGWCVQRTVRTQQNRISFNLRPLRKLGGPSIAPTHHSISKMVAIQPRSQSSSLHNVLNQFEPTVVGLAGSGDRCLLPGFDVFVYLGNNACLWHLQALFPFSTGVGGLAISCRDSCSRRVSRCVLLLRCTSGSIPAARPPQSEGNGLRQRLD